MRIAIKSSCFAVILASLVCIVCIVILLLFPLQAGAGRWSGYRVLTLPFGIPERDIQERLDKAGVSDYITQANSNIASRIQEAPVQPFLEEINVTRAAWFIDAEQNLRFIYLRNISFLDSRIENAFSGSAFSWNLEQTAGITPVPAILIFFMCITGLMFVKNRAYQSFCGIPFILLSVSCNRPSGFIALFFSVYIIIFVSDLFSNDGKTATAKQQLARLRGLNLLLLPFLASLIASFSDGLHSGLLFIASLCASVSTIPLVKAGIILKEKLHERKRLHPVFKPQIMNPGSIKKNWTRKTVIVISAAGIIFTGAGIVFFNFYTAQSAMGRELYIPTPTGYTERTGFNIESYTELLTIKDKSGLPDLTDFLSTQWQIYTFPYRRIQESIQNPGKGSTSEYFDYIIDENGLISPKKNLINTFNTEFIKKRLSLDSTPLEKMLIRQNRFVTVGKRVNNDTNFRTDGNLVFIYLLYLLIPGAAILMRLKK